MTRFVIGPDVAIRMARESIEIPDRHRLVAPTLLRSQVLARLYAEVRGGTLEQRAAESALDYLRGLKIRLLGDRVSQRNAWRIAERLGWDDTYDAEYMAVTVLQADAFVTLDRALARAAKDIVEVAPFAALTERQG